MDEERKEIVKKKHDKKKFSFDTFITRIDVFEFLIEIQIELKFKKKIFYTFYYKCNNKSHISQNYNKL